MLRNYIITAWRNIRNNKVYSLINITGLAVGMAASIIILLFVFYEKSFDNLHSKNIYRLNEVQKFEGMVAPQNVALSMYPMGPTLKAEFPEIKNFARVNNFENITLDYNTNKIVLPKALWADSTFLDIFDFELITGDRKKLLEKPGSIVLTESTATRIFGKENPIGKTIHYYGNDTFNFSVTGIMDDLPKNSHLQFDALLSFNTVTTPQNMTNWGGNWVITYLELDKNANLAALHSKFPGYLKKYMNADQLDSYELFLQPLKEIHSRSVDITHDYLNYQKFDQKHTYVFSIIAIIVLFIACVNFMNLSTARSAGRAKEVGIRKTIGAERVQLGKQFLGESVLLSFISLAFALVLAQLFLPYVSKLSGRELSLPISDPVMLLAIVAGTFVVGIISGLYPAFYLSSFRPIIVLKGGLQAGKNKGLFRNILVVGQFSIAVFLIIATVIAIRQLDFMRKKDPGFSYEQVVTVPLNSKAFKNYHALKQELLGNPMISAVSGSQQRLGNNLHQTSVHFYGDSAMRELTSSQVIVDPDYLKLYKIPLLAGRNFSNDPKEIGRTYIINETLARELLKDKPKAPLASLIGTRFGFSWNDSAASIIGISKDFNFNSLHHKIETLCILNQDKWGFDEMSVRIQGSNPEAAISHIAASWKKINPDNPFEYHFLDSHFEELYKADKQVSSIIGIMATLAIFISCLGLFGLASYSAEKRVKEIGIRKVLGASVNGVVTLLSKDFVKLVLIANLIAWPIAWIVLNKWLQDFAYRVSVSWWVFLFAGGAAILIAFFTVSFLALKAAMSNPVKSLRTE